MKPLVIIMLLENTMFPNMKNYIWTLILIMRKDRMKKRSLMMLLGIIMILAACSEENVSKDKEDQNKVDTIDCNSGSK
ncbi:hypothetical protein [Sporosarcina sp. P17b]|uniref:hypothetical protein n=2 Tax=Sporosarcina TaxID=1569 RepID=UPI0013044331|nr:hypothetical protein [Sporosarcina sp. P17b]